MSESIGTCVLVHGGWHGGWHWDEVVKRLRRLEVAAHAPTLRGLAERAEEATPETDLADHVADVVSVLDEHDMREIVLVGHSYGGMVITGVAAERPERISRLIYLDAFVPEDGQSVGDLLGDEFRANARAAAKAAGTPSMVPPMFSAEAILGWTGERAEEFEARLCGQPIGTLDDPVRAAARPSVPRSYVYCSAVPLGIIEPFAESARASADWRYFELPSPHDAVHIMPAAVAGIIAAHVEEL